MKRLIVRALFWGSFVLSTSSVWASNGLQVIGAGPDDIALGGAGVANPNSAHAIYINPAGMNDIGNRADLSFTIAFPKTSMGTSLAKAGNPTAVSVKGSGDAVILPNGSFVFSFGENHRFSLGVGAIFSGGFSIEYPQSRISNLITKNTYDLSGRYANFKILPAFSYRVMKNLSLGAALDINYALFQTDNALPLPGFPQTTGRDRTDSALGIGARIGFIYQPHERIKVGAMYVTRQHFEKFKRYNDLFNNAGLDLPQQVVVGVSVVPFEGATWLADFKWLNWDSGFLGRPVTRGGLDWRDQYVLATGFQYNFRPHFHFPLTLRLGYNYGRSPVGKGNTFQNLLVPTTVENHLTTGMSFEITKHIGVDAAYVHEFQKTLTDDGSVNPLFSGAFFKSSAEAFSIGIHGAWGHQERASN
ncbi:MAG: outer membrane protein transport protein [Deltaproteobacteria bacterium]|nr:outer membrane protein transport protein [Deltaproteobacteria bacterium]